MHSSKLKKKKKRKNEAVKKKGLDSYSIVKKGKQLESQ